MIGAGPAGLSAAIEAAKNGMKPIVFDENAKPGGQLFKQIHKFFGSKEHKAKIRGFNIGYELLEEANKLGVDVRLNATVVGLYDEKEVTVRIGDGIKHFKGDSVLVLSIPAGLVFSVSADNVYSRGQYFYIYIFMYFAAIVRRNVSFAAENHSTEVVQVRLDAGMVMLCICQLMPNDQKFMEVGIAQITGKFL